MKKIAVCFTSQGEDVIEKLNSVSREKGLGPFETYTFRDTEKVRTGFTGVTESIGEWTRLMFKPENALYFVGAVGIAVRAVSGLPKDKLSDCPVIVIDDNGRFVIPILSGHAGVSASQ